VPESPKWMIPRHASSRRRTTQIYFALSRFLRSSARTLVLRTPELPNADIPISPSLGLSLCCSMREGLNLVQLLTDPTAVGCLDQDLTAQTISPVHFKRNFNPCAHFPDPTVTRVHLPSRSAPKASALLVWSPLSLWP
jgi:hypothetical protein